MDYTKIGNLISELRKEKNMTQQNLADKLNISNKTVSKWERGLGCPDVSLWNNLSDNLGVNIRQIIEGELNPNLPDIGNIDKIKFYVCQVCGNTITSTSKASISCCGRTIEPLTPIKADKEHYVQLEEMDLDYYLSFNHEMSKSHYIAFVAYVKSDQVILNRLYPEQTAAARIPIVNRTGRIYIYCVNHGLQVHSMNDLLKKIK